MVLDSKKTAKKVVIYLLNYILTAALIDFNDFLNYF